MNPKELTRREFIAGSALALTGCATMTAARPRTRTRSPGEKLNVAAIGCGGKGAGDIGACAGENIVALCDVDFNQAAGSFKNWPDAKRYYDYRVMLEKQKDIEAVTISTPDHSHAPAAMMAMELGIHVYVQKPLTHTVEEARLLRRTARRTGVVTQMGNQGHARDGVRRTAETIWSGLIGDVHEVHCWTDRPVWPQNVELPIAVQDVPEHVDWDLWIGPSPFHHYNGDYLHPFRWRGWWDYGCGALGDMGCHIMDPAFWVMDLDSAGKFTVEALEVEGGNEATGPAVSVIRYEFPKRGGMPPVSVTWYDGKKKPEPPQGVPPDMMGDNGSLFIGSEGMLICGTYGDNPKLLPEDKMRDFTWPEQVLPRVPGGSPHAEWLEACKGGKTPGSNFEYSAPFTEMVLLGNIALRTSEKIEWDVRRMEITNLPDANRFVKKEYRPGWAGLMA